MTPRRAPGALRRASRPAGGRGARSAAQAKTRALGQHFLRDDRVAGAIVSLVGPTARDLVVEIGPGAGALTGRLAAACGRLIGLEADPGLAARLRQRFATAPHVEILDADARSFDYSSLPARRPDAAGRVLAVGNLPYSVSKPILAALLAAGRAVDEMALMLQKEVAERVAAAPGGRTYGSLSVLTQLGCEVRLCLEVPPGAFRPPPRVDSAVIHLRVRPSPPVAVADVERFRKVVQAAFAQRRKTLANALAAGLGLEAASARAFVEAASIDPRRRAETLTLAEFARLAALPPGT